MVTPPPTRPGVPLRDRPIGDEEPATSTAARRHRRHCWIDLTGHPTYASASETEGLVLQWAQDARGWVALVVYVVPASGGDVTVQEWVPAAKLRPDRIC